MNTKNLIILVCLIFMGNVLLAQNTYIGAAKCKMCHSGAAKGDQFKKWSDSKHSKSATATGVSGKAECEKCHAPVADFKTEGVTCEVCHGAGSAYKSAMKPLTAAQAKGLVVPTEATCKNCHDAGKAPSGHKAIPTFNFATASATIAHKKP